MVLQSSYKSNCLGAGSPRKNNGEEQRRETRERDRHRVGEVRECGKRREKKIERRSETR